MLRLESGLLVIYLHERGSCFGGSHLDVRCHLCWGFLCACFIAGLALLGPIEEKFVDVTDLFVPKEDGTKDKAFISRGGFRFRAIV